MNAAQQRQLQLYLRFRGQRMTVAGLIWASRRVYLLLLLLFGALAGLLYVFVAPVAATYVGLALFVAVLRDVGYFRRSARIWPILDQVLDWNQIEPLAGHTDTRSK